MLMAMSASVTAEAVASTACGKPTFELKGSRKAKKVKPRLNTDAYALVRPRLLKDYGDIVTRQDRGEKVSASQLSHMASTALEMGDIPQIADDCIRRMVLADSDGVESQKFIDSAGRRHPAAATLALTYYAPVALMRISDMPLNDVRPQIEHLLTLSRSFPTVHTQTIEGVAAMVDGDYTRSRSCLTAAAGGYASARMSDAEHKLYAWVVKALTQLYYHTGFDSQSYRAQTSVSAQPIVTSDFEMAVAVAEQALSQNFLEDADRYLSAARSIDDERYRQFVDSRKAPEPADATVNTTASTPAEPQTEDYYPLD